MTTNASQAKNTNKPFVTDVDKIKLKPHVVSFEEDMKMFLLELRPIFTEVWSSDHVKTLENLEEKDIEHFNRLIDYPSWGGYAVLEDSFTACSDEEIVILSDRSKEFLEYFYGISLALVNFFNINIICCR